MVTITVLAIAAVFALANGNDSIEDLRTDYRIKEVGGGNKANRLAGWHVNSGKTKKCDMVRRQYKTFGYCWDDDNEKQNPPINTSQERQWVREVIQQWEKCGGIKFVEEPKCRIAPDFVTVTVGDYGPVLMPELDIGTCTIKNFTMYISFYTFGANVASYRRTEKVRKSMIQMYALHEFGHFLGFDHEQNRNDRTECIWQVDDAETGDNPIYGNYHITKEYDLESIMNYCRPNVHYKPWLSVHDKKGVAAAYGGGDLKECDAVTKPWKWGPNEGLDEYVLKKLEYEEKGITCYDLMPTTQCEGLRQSCADAGMDNWCSKTCGYCGPTPKPPTGGQQPTAAPAPAPGGCADVSSKSECDKRLDSCKHKSMEYWCPKSCGYCK